MVIEKITQCSTEYLLPVQVYTKHPLLTIEEYCNDTEHTFDAFTSDTTLPLNASAEDVLSIENKTMRSLMDSGFSDSPAMQPNTALFCTILALGTFFVAYYLRQFRNSKFLGRSVSTQNFLIMQIKGGVITY